MSGLVCDRMTVREFVSLGRTPYAGLFDGRSKEDEKIVDEAVSLLELENFTNRWVNELSDGERSRVYLAQAVAQQVPQAQVEEVKDTNGLKAVKVTFDSGILFATNKADLSSSAKTSLVKFAEVLKQNTDMDLAIYGHTDNTGTDAINDPLSLRRAESVSGYLSTCGVSSNQFKTIEGKGSKLPVATNETVEGRAQNRRVEVYLYASEQMIKQAEAEANKN